MVFPVVYKNEGYSEKGQPFLMPVQPSTQTGANKDVDKTDEIQRT
jgi:hypothetical protein